MARSNTHALPNQNVPASKKRTKKWQKQTIDAFVDMSTFGRHIHQRSDLKKLYEYYNGDIHKDDYKHVLKPYGKERRNVPADLQNYNIIKPIVDVLIGEKARRPIRDSVTVVNSDAVTRREKALINSVNKTLRQNLFAMLEQQGIDLGGQGQPPTPQQVIDEFEENYTDERGILGQKALNFIKKYCEVYRKFQKGWFHWLVSGEVYSLREVQSNEPRYKILNPLDIDYDKDPDLEFVEDGDWAIVRSLMYPSSVVDVYHEDLSDDEITRIEDPQFSQEQGYLIYDHDEDGLVSDDRLVEVFRVFWKTRKKIKFVTYLDEFGELQERIEDENYQLQEGETLQETRWINEVWEGHRIDRDIYKRIGPIENQRRSMDNPSRCKLPINGRKYSNINAASVSVVSIARPYQLIYNIYKYRLELAIAKSKDILAVMDINAIPKDWDMDKFMHFVETTGVMWVDYTKEGIELNPQQQNVLDLTIKTIDSYIALLESIRLELEEATGVNRQRKGQVNQYEGKGVTEQSIIQSSHITEDLFRKFASFEQRDLQALLDYSQQAWINGKKTSYVMPDGTVEFLSIENTDEFANEEFGVFVSDSTRDQEKFRQLKGLSEAALQNGTGLDTIAEMLDSESFTVLKEKIKKAEEQRRQLEQQAQETEANVRAQEVEAKLEEARVKEEANIRDNATKIEEALIDAQNKLEMQERKMQVDQEQHRDEVSLDKEELDEQKRHNRAQESIDRIEAEIKKRSKSEQ